MNKLTDTSNTVDEDYIFYGVPLEERNAKNITLGYPDLPLRSQDEEIAINKAHNKERIEAIEKLALPTDDRGHTLDIFGKSASFSNILTLKADGAQLPLTQLHIDEIIKCRDSVHYFAENFIRITTPMGYSYFKLRNYQKQLLTHYTENRYTTTLTGRQSAKSVLTAIYILHKTMFGKDGLKFGILANKGDLAKENLSRIRNFYQGLPLWLQIGLLTWQATSINLSGNRMIMSSGTTEDAFRGESLGNGIYIDEAAFIPDEMLESLETSLFPAIAQFPDASIMMTTTPKGKNYFYTSNWLKVINGIGKFKGFRVPLRAIPGRETPEYVDEMIDTVGVLKFNQEFLAAFIGSSNTLILGEHLEKIERYISKVEPITNDHLIEGMIQYKEPIEEHKYVISVDGAKDGLDALSVQVVDVTFLPFEQVVSCSINVEYLRMPFYINALASQYNNALCIIENNEGSGSSIGDTLSGVYEYENLWFDNDKTYSGFRTTTKTRNQILSTMKLFIEGGYLTINDPMTLAEFQTFTSNNKGKFTAEGTNHDDRVMSLALIFAPFVNIKNIDNYDKMVEALNKDKKIRSEQQEELTKILSIGFVGDDDVEYGDTEDWELDWDNEDE